MKFVALALALLLAIGSHAASVQTEVPSQLEHARSILDLYLNQIKDSANKVLAHLDGTEYEELKVTLSQRLDDMYSQLKALQASVSPLTDSFVITLSDATADFRAAVDADIQALKAEIEPKRVELKDVLTKHLDGYREQLEPIIQDYHAKNTAQLDALKLKLDPVLEAMKTKVAENVEETKTAMMPILESVYAKVSERLQNLKELASPYVEEYKEQLKQAYGQAKTVNAEELEALKEKLAPMAEEIKAKITEMFELTSATFNKS